MGIPHLNYIIQTQLSKLTTTDSQKNSNYTAVERTLRNNTPLNETFSHNTGATTSGMMNFSSNNITHHGFLKEFQSHFTNTIQRNLTSQIIPELSGKVSD